MLRIEAILSEARRRGRLAIMPFITAGYPSLDVTRRALPELERAGASIVEIGFPFTDPIADGPVIAASMHEALHAGASPAAIFDLVHRLRDQTSLGLIAMVSDSIITRIGPERFVSEAAAAGFDGLIVPDIDLQAARPLRGLAQLHKLSLTLLIAPTTTPQRARDIVELCSGFVYLLARAGVTGAGGPDVSIIEKRAAMLREVTTLPIAVGFGIAERSHLQALQGIADAAIVGSALVRKMGEAADPVRAAGSFIAKLAGGM